MDFRSSIPGLLLRAEDLRSDASSVSKISVTLECCLIPLSYSVSFTSIAFPRAMSSLVYTITIHLVQPSIYLRSFILLSYGSRLHRCSTVSRIPRRCLESTLSARHLGFPRYPLALILP